jgi:hypothetical protein
MGKTFWELGGVAADPQVEYDVAVTANTVGSAAGTITFRGAYLVQN